jgi:putative restriction endonuclease
VKNGLLLRRDLPALIDKGYITVTPTMNIEVSRMIKEGFETGRDYYRFQGNRIYLPTDASNILTGDYLAWHNQNVYRG